MATQRVDRAGLARHRENAQQAAKQQIERTQSENGIAAVIVGGIVALAVAWVILMALLAAVRGVVDGIAASPIPLVGAVVLGAAFGLWIKAGQVSGEPWWAKIVVGGFAVWFLAMFPLGGLLLGACAAGGYFSTRILDQARKVLRS
jgi:hypothetical protein